MIKRLKIVLNKPNNSMFAVELREMENVVALYDKALFSRWESVKTTHKPQLFKSLLTDIKVLRMPK